MNLGWIKTASLAVLLCAVTIACAAIGKEDGAKTAEAKPDPSKELFNGKDLTGWEGNADVFSVENGEIVGKSEKGLADNEFLKSKMKLKDFRLIVQVKLTPNKENSGIQIRSEIEPNGHMKGYQADMGANYWGTLYDEGTGGRGQIWKKRPPRNTVKQDEWNTYEILAVGHKIRTAINGVLCVDMDDPEGELEGVIGLQAHAGGPLEVRFKDFQLELDPQTTEMKTVEKKDETPKA